MAAFMRAATRKKRQRVVETAVRLFVERGYEQVSVDEIIQAANISKGTFYHYFESKEDLLGELTSVQADIVERWLQTPPALVPSLEGHINRLFLDLGSNIAEIPRLIRSLASLAMSNENVRRRQAEQLAALEAAVMKWLPDRRKAELLVATYFGTLTVWAYRERPGLLADLQSNLSAAWAGLRAAELPAPVALPAKEKEGVRMKVAIIGGGLAGLTAAAYLSEHSGIEGVLFERSPQLGGRAFTYEKSGFTLNYGAHAIYALDRHELTNLENELGLSFGSKQVDKRKVVYAKDELITPAPLDAMNLMKTELLPSAQKVRFVAEIAAIIANIHHMKNYRTLGDYLAEAESGEDLKELWEHLVCSNFFIAPSDARKVPGAVIEEYYHNLFLSSRPVNYVLGSWAVITNQLKQKVESSGRWAIKLQEAAEEIRYENRKYRLRSKNGEDEFDRIVFAMPVQQVVKLLRGTPWEPFLADYEGATPTEVMVYDVGLSEVVARPFSYISDMNRKLFISDVSATDHTVVPEGGQLLQGIAYLEDAFDSEEERKAYLDEKTAQMEATFDAHYPGWREKVVVKRVSKKAMVASVKNIVTNRLLPVRLEHVPFYFCGDGCEGKGELAERAFSSARAAARQLLAEAKKEALQRA
ncbi:FAD-dependent oxidoreductase [Paenibacillus sp.]|uniref:FAD-dependent oxidoreductase n=1 Tax=Paenibacillus sp. TaxID=58172 RepID=UPI002D5EADBD|nr:FAD-dependent oxidoreductase [Paenibacillus sp.]HZG54862.1 FAD-dependent oxidoreductase [Paenibacillus sp.]